MQVEANEKSPRRPWLPGWTAEGVKGI